MSDRQARLLLSCARTLVARIEELLLSRAAWRGKPGEDAADWYGVAVVQKDVGRLTRCAADKGLGLAERVALARTYRERAGERRGRPRKGEPKKSKINQGIGGFPWCPLRSGMRLDDGAARVSGFSNREQARLARLVVERGGPELAAKVDRGEMSLTQAAAMVRQAVRA